MLSSEPRGFICGDDTDSTLYNVPCLLERLQEWDSTIHAALQDIFCLPGTNEYQIIQNKHGRGYEALFDIICSDHLEHDKYPSLLIKDRPAQQECQSISDYFNEYVNYLKLSTYCTDVSVNLKNCKRKNLQWKSLPRKRVPKQNIGQTLFKLSDKAPCTYTAT